ncbi:2-hydroxylaminobenzoate mutase [Paramagnetospirillum marisnigri]|uniref:2-hydroxylaminobenzoate mutase n=1 Tax=Paramagnetospirillum marisnigri TaxID=1285242 RepID=A0A178MTV4_9PROT|nr:DUF4863 family protein [Paramagnetospirillum marisnigri]OAN52246.1 2-hydroxylaminobenzoate mutase [Paramagnetospirillum marisnigri]
MSKTQFQALVSTITSSIAGRAVDDDLKAFLAAQFPPEGETFKAIEAACHQGVAEGWMCDKEHGGIRYGRVIEATPDLAGYSVDVVLMKDLAGPHHRHPEGEIDMVMPITPTARFDGSPKGWVVYGPDSAHRPTVSEGESLVLYLLPGGKIDFTRNK